MINRILALLAVPVLALSQGVTNDYILQQKPASGPLVVRPVTPAVGKILGWPSSINTPAAITIGSGLDLTAGTLTATGGTSAWADITGKPANVVSFGSLANAAGVLTNNGSGTLSYTATSTGGNGSADASKLTRFDANGGISLGSLANDLGATPLTIFSGTANAILIETDGVGGQAIDIQLNGASAQGYSIHGSAASVVGLLYDGAGDTGSGIGARLSTNGAGLLVCNADDNDKLGIKGSTGNIEWYGSGTSPFAGSNKTILAPITPSGTNTISVPAITGTMITSGDTGTITGGMIAQAGATSGQAIAWNGSAWAPATVGVSDGDKGSLTVSGSGSSWVIDPSAVTDSMLAGSITPSKVTGTAAILGANTFTDAQTLTGVPVTGTGTTATPLVNIRPTSGVTAVTTQNATGTAIGATLQDASSADFIAFWRSNTPLGRVTYLARFLGMEMINTGVSGFQIYTSQASAQTETTGNRSGLFGDVATGLRMASGYQVGWSANAAGAADAYNLDTQIVRAAAAVVGIRNGSTGGASVEFTEQTAPTGVANTARIYAEDNGAGKTRLMVIFGSGAAQQIAIEP